MPYLGSSIMMSWSGFQIGRLLINSRPTLQSFQAKLLDVDVAVNGRTLLVLLLTTSVPNVMR